MNTPRLLYTALLWLLSPYILFHLLWRARKQPEYLQHIPERFGFFKTYSKKPVIWLHTVSVGETRAAATLVQRLQQAYPEHQILLTHTTPTGRDASVQLYGNKVLRVYLPYDYPFAVKRFLHHFKPQIGILLETEIWFSLIYFCHQADIPLLLLNARLSEKSARGYGRFGALTRNGLQQLSVIAAQTQDDAARLEHLGARNVSVMGNLKYDIQPPHAQLETGKHLRQLWGSGRKVFLAASTREGEEELILQKLQQIKLSGFLTVIVPRHPQRFDEVAKLIERYQFKYQRRSDNQPIATDTQIVLGDSMGEMFAYYAACDITFIGGSLLPFGGQNLIEACAVGKPVLIGPHTFNFTQASTSALEHKAAILIRDAEELANIVRQLFEHPAASAAMGRAGLAFVRINQGATEKARQLIADTLQPGAHGAPYENALP